MVTEVVYLLGTRLGADPEVRFLGDLAAGNLIVEPVAASDWMRIAELVAQYADLPLGTVDASVIAAAERLGVSDIATLDRRHFTVVESKIDSLHRRDWSSRRSACDGRVRLGSMLRLGGHGHAMVA